MRVRRATVEHPFGTLKAWMGATHFKTRTLEKVRTEMSLHVLAYNLKRVIAILGAQPLMEAMRARTSKAHASQQVRRNPTIGNRQPANHPPITHLRFYTASVESGRLPARLVPHYSTAPDHRRRRHHRRHAAFLIHSANGLFILHKNENQMQIHRERTHATRHGRNAKVSK